MMDNYPKSRFCTSAADCIRGDCEELEGCFAFVPGYVYVGRFFIFRFRIRHDLVLKLVVMCHSDVFSILFGELLLLAF